MSRLPASPPPPRRRFDPLWPLAIVLIIAGLIALNFLNDSARRVSEEGEAAAQATLEMRRQLREHRPTAPPAAPPGGYSGLSRP